MPLNATGYLPVTGGGTVLSTLEVSSAGDPVLEHPDLVQAQSMIGFASAAFQQAILPGIALPQRAGTACPLPPALVVRILYVPALISTRRYSSLLTACAMLFHPQAALAKQCGFGTGNYGIHMEFHSRTSGPHFLILKYSSMTSNVPSASGVSTPLQVSWQPVFSQAHVSSLAGYRADTCFPCRSFQPIC